MSTDADPRGIEALRAGRGEDRRERRRRGVGTVSSFRGGTVDVDPDPDLADSLTSNLGWGDDYPPATTTLGP